MKSHSEIIRKSLAGTPEKNGEGRQARIDAGAGQFEFIENRLSPYYIQAAQLLDILEVTPASLGTDGEENLKPDF